MVFIIFSLKLLLSEISFDVSIQGDSGNPGLSGAIGSAGKLVSMNRDCGNISIASVTSVMTLYRVTAG